MKAPKVSVIMPVYNAEKYVSQAIESTLNQTFRRFELLMIDDASTDNSLKIMRLYQDSRIKILENDKNLGVVATRNRGIRAAQGKYIAIMDADDLMKPQRLEKQVDILCKYPEIGLVSSSAEIINAKNEVVGAWNLCDTPENIPYILLFRNFFVHSSLMIRASLSDIYYDENFKVAEDYDLIVRLAKHSKIYSFSEYLVQYRSHNHSLIQEYGVDLERYNTLIIRKQLANLGLIPTEYEYEIHRQVGQLRFIRSKTFVRAVHAWLTKLYLSNKEHKVYPKNTFKIFLQNLWFLVCLENISFLGFIVKQFWKSSLTLSFRQKMYLLLVGLKRFFSKPKS